MASGSIGKADAAGLVHARFGMEGKRVKAMAATVVLEEGPRGTPCS